MKSTLSLLPTTFLFGAILIMVLIVFCIVGAFEDPDIIHVDDLVDPVRDLETISAELRLKVELVPVLSRYIHCGFKKPL